MLFRSLVVKGYKPAPLKVTFESDGPTVSREEPRHDTIDGEVVITRHAIES